MSVPFRSMVAALGALMCAVAPQFAQAQTYPTKPVTMIVAYPAGGDADVLARVFAEKLTTRLGQPVVVDNRPGASGTIGSSFVAKAPADGHTLLFAPSTVAIAPLVLKTGSGAAYDVLDSFTPIMEVGTQPLFLAVSTTTGAKDFKQFMALARQPGKNLQYASPGSGSPMHILGEMFNKATGANLIHVPYRGVAPAINDLLGGHVPATWMTYGPVAPHLATGKVALLAVADPKRSELAPQVPTLAESGVKDVEVGAWQGVFGPKGMPPAVVKTLNTNLNEILKMHEVNERMLPLGVLPLGGDPSRLAQTNANDYHRFSKIIQTLGIQAD